MIELRETIEAAMPETKPLEPERVRSLVEGDTPKLTAYAERLVGRRDGIDGIKQPKQKPLHSSKGGHVKPKPKKNKRKLKSVPRCEHVYKRPSVDRVSVELRGSTRSAEQCGAAAVTNRNVKRTLRKLGLPKSTARFYGEMFGWRKLLGRDIATGKEAPEYECEGRRQKDSPIVPREYPEVSDPKAELRDLMQSAMATLEPTYKREVAVVDGRLKQIGPEHYWSQIASAKADLNNSKGKVAKRKARARLAEVERKLKAITIQPKQPETIGEFVDRFPQHEQAVARLLRKINPERKEA